MEVSVSSITYSCTSYKEIKVNYVSTITGRCFLSFVRASLPHCDGNICVLLEMYNCLQCGHNYYSNHTLYRTIFDTYCNCRTVLLSYVAKSCYSVRFLSLLVGLRKNINLLNVFAIIYVYLLQTFGKN